MDNTLLDYYRRRAREYERIYDKPERQADLHALTTHLQTVLTGYRVLELACGTGYWTSAIADAVDSILATDASEEVLEIARAKNLNPAKVSFSVADVWNPEQPHCRFTAGLAAFWWSHVPRKRLPDFLERFHAALQPGARVVFADNRFVIGSSTPLSRTDGEGNTYQVRRLDDDSSHEVLKNFPTTDELHAAVEPYAIRIDVREFEYFWCVAYELHGHRTGATFLSPE